MNKEQLVERIAQVAGLSKKDANTALDAALDTIKTALRRGEKVTLVGFGTFQVRERRAREGRNPQTGEKIRIPARKVPAFTAGKELRAAVAGARRR
ncbi:MAG: HU family DNA-binding protein [Armatimonadota bacterium]|nr:HU family DNA-binding protein [Armatimonadota bacterium]MDR7438889.1 HU family DNA-binding protein [Armatimonadota bacterium]MDR7562429.1 HU family DNA-binding protein [Armatimonadota bacterium]MDR7568697.1 HU family DNA-binding protein [Armatimonadota bacterium]MDR7601509.1 HU family DNA-binding protein [Armatimonadota bacterium]